MEIMGKNVLVVGNARSGIGAAKLAHQKGATVCIYDGKPYEAWQEEAKQTINELKSQGIMYTLGEMPDVKAFDLVVMSPGISPEIEVVQLAKQLGKRLQENLNLLHGTARLPLLLLQEQMVKQRQPL